MTPPLRIALLGGAIADRVAGALRDAGHRPVLIDARGLPTVDGLLRRRGFTDGLSRVPAAFGRLAAGDFDVAHAFSAPDAYAAQRWRRIGGTPVVFTCTDVLDRSSVASARLRLSLLTGALERSDAVTALDPRAREALQRWMTIDAPVVAADDARGHDALYRRVIADRAKVPPR